MALFCVIFSSLPPVLVDSAVLHVSEEIVEALGNGQTAPVPPAVVRGNTMLTATLDVQGCQIKTELLARFLNKARESKDIIECTYIHVVCM